MKGLILSGGRGTRLRPLTYAGTKQLIPVANKPILFYAIETLRQAGIREMGIIVGDNHGEVEETVGDGSRWDLDITFIHQPEPLGLAHAAYTARPFLQEVPFVMYLGDNLLEEGIDPLVKRFKETEADAAVLLAPVKEPQNFGIAEMDRGKVTRVVEKPSQPRSNLALVGVYLFTSMIFGCIERIKPSWRNELEITDAIQVLLEDGARVEACPLTGWWKDTGRPDSLLEANRVMLGKTSSWVGKSARVEASTIQAEVSIGSGTRIAGSLIRGPVAIGEGCLIENAYIGPYTSVGDGVQIEGTEVEHSILMAGCRLKDAGRFADSIIGRGTEIRRLPGKPEAVRLVVADDSSLILA